MPLNVPVEPVKCTPAMRLSASTVSPTTGPGPGTKLITPRGRPAASNIFIACQFESTEVVAGFHTQVLPMSTGAVGRLIAIEVKLKGVIASTKPSSGRCSSRFHMPGADCGCSEYSRAAKWALKRRKSIASQAESISAWCTVFDWPSIVAALMRSRHVLANNSPARSITAARSCQGRRSQSCRARAAASQAAATSLGPARCTLASVWRWSWGMRTSSVLPVRTSSPSISSGISITSAAWRASSALSRSFSGEPGA